MGRRIGRAVTMASGLLLLLLASGAMGSRPKSPRQARPDSVRVRIYVNGDVDASLQDDRGRRSGWFGGFVDDIPDCIVEADHDDVVRPTEYTFRFVGKSAASYGLMLKARSVCTATIQVETTAPDSQRVIVVADSALDVEEREYLWRVDWRCTRRACRPQLVPTVSLHHMRDLR